MTNCKPQHLRLATLHHIPTPFPGHTTKRASIAIARNRARKEMERLPRLNATRPTGRHAGITPCVCQRLTDRPVTALPERVYSIDCSDEGNAHDSKSVLSLAYHLADRPTVTIYTPGSYISPIWLHFLLFERVCGDAMAWVRQYAIQLRSRDSQTMTVVSLHTHSFRIAQVCKRKE